MENILIVGEVLFDEFENGHSVLGGAPFNVSWHLKGLGDEPLFVSRVGKDKLGNKILQNMEKWDLDASGVQFDLKHETGIVKVKLNDNNPTFEILYPQAYDFIDYDLIKNSIKNKSISLIYHGSLALRHEISANAIVHLKDKNPNAKVFVDINLRSPWWNRDIILKAIKRVDYLKINEDELNLILKTIYDREVSIKDFVKDFNIEVLIITKSSRGATLVTSDEEVILSAPKIKNFKDSVGAGDAFSAVCIKGLLKDWDKELILKRAIEFSSTICKIEGAISNDKKIYKDILEKWKK